MRRSAMWLIAAVVLAVCTAQAGAPPVLLWTRTFASVDTSVKWIQQTADGGFIAAGRILPSRALTPWDVDMYLLKLDSGGNTVWQDTYSSGETHDYALSVQQTRDGGYVLVGGGNAGSVIVLKADSVGAQQWRFNGFAGATAYSIQQTADGGYVTAGLWRQDDSLYVLKLDSLGGVSWHRCYDEFYGHWRARIPVQQTAEGGYIVAAEALVRTDGAGNPLWKHKYEDVLVLFSVQQTSDGFIAAGIAHASGLFGRAKPYNMVLLKTNPAGALSWRKVFTFGEESGALSVSQTSDGGYVLGGYVTSGDSSRATVIRTNSQGDTLWTKTFPAPTIVERVQQTSDGGYILCQGSRRIWRLAPDAKRR